MNPFRSIRHLGLLVLFPVLFELPIMLKFGAIAVGDAELIQKLALIRHLRDGLPLTWTQLVDCGTIFFGSTNASLSPWDGLLFLVNPFWVANLAFTSYLVVAGMGFYGWRVGKCGTSPWAALFGALVYQGSSYALINTSIGHETLMQQYGWFPLALWLVDDLAEGNRRRFVWGFPWVIFAMSLSTYPLMTWILGSVLGLRLIWVVGLTGGEWRRLAVDVCVYGAASVVGLGFFAFFFVPAAHFASQTISPGHPEFNIPDYRYHITWPITHLVTLVNPYFFGGAARGTFWSNYLAHTRIGGFHEYVVYCGLAPLAVVWLFRKSLWKSREGRFWFLCLALYTWISLGKWAGLYVLLAKLPVLSAFRGPARYTVIWPIALSVLACLALDQNRENRAACEKCIQATMRLLIVALAVAFIAWVGMSILFAHLEIPSGVDPTKAARIFGIVRQQILPSALANLLASVGLALGMATVWGWWRIHRQRSFRALMGLLLVDLSATAWVFCWQPSGNYEFYQEVSPVANWLGAHTRPGGERVMAGYALPILRALQDRFQQIDGYKPLHLPWYQEFMNQLNRAPIRMYDTYDYRAKNPNSPLVRFLRVRYVVSKGPMEVKNARMVVKFGETYVYETRDIWPLFYRSPVWQNIPDKTDRLAFVENAIAGNRVPMVTEEKPAACPEGRPVMIGRNTELKSDWDGALSFRVVVDGDRSSLIGSSIAYYDEWRATTREGKPLKVLRVNHAFLGAEVPPGTREVRFYFEARYHRLGCWLSLMAFGIYLGAVIVWRNG